MNYFLPVNRTGRPHFFGEHASGSDTIASRPRNADQTPLILALGFTVFVLAALVWCCFSSTLRTRAVKAGYTDPETVVENEPTFSDSFTGMNTQHDPGNSKVLRSTENLTRSVTLPHPVYGPFHHGISFSTYRTGSLQRSEYMALSGRQHDSLSSLPSLSCPPYRPASALIEQDIHPPPEYSSPPGSPLNPTSTQAPTPSIRDWTRFLEVGFTNETPHASLISTALSCPDTAHLLWKPAEWKGVPLPLSLSQPTIKGIPSSLNRTFSLPGRHTADNIFSEPAFHTPGLTTESCTTLYGTYTIFVDHNSGRIIPRLSIPSGQVATSDSIVTIRPCDMVAAAGRLSDAEFYSDDRACNDSCHAVTPLAIGYLPGDGISQTEGFDEGPTSSRIHEANLNGTQSIEISA